uniref:Uncharacterized protein n=1 Tax=Romanomermis culicivorax TaxID=13658 RepID=A0A915IVR4_ROMCU
MDKLLSTISAETMSMLRTTLKEIGPTYWSRFSEGPDSSKFFCFKKSSFLENNKCAGLNLQFCNVNDIKLPRPPKHQSRALQN